MIKRIYLEITDSCNLNCSFCTNEKGNHFMSQEDFVYFLKQIKPVCDYIYLHVLGEPLLHPLIDEFLDILDDMDFKLQLVTNGVLLNKHKDILKHKCLRKLSISLHSINNLNIDDKYFESIDELISSNSNTNIELRFYNEKSLDNKLNDYLNNLKNKYSFTETPKINSYRLKNNVYVYFNDLFDWPNINDPFISESGICHGIKNQLAILHNGDLTTCCLDPKGNNKIGNLKDKTLIQIINSDNYLKILNNLNNNKLTQEMCKRCTYRLRFSKQ